MSVDPSGDPASQGSPMPPLVFLPGAGGRGSFWRAVSDRLSDLGEAHRFAWPGFGECPPDPSVRSLAHLHAWLLGRLPPGRSDVIAQSMGGVLAVRLAIEHPDRIARLVLVATSGGVDVRRHGAVDWRPEYRATLSEAPAWFVDDRTDLTDRLGEIRAPTLLLWSDADPVSPLGVGRFLEERIPDARLVVVQGGSHAFAEERAEEVARAIREHLLQVGARASSRAPARSRVGRP